MPPLPSVEQSSRRLVDCLMKDKDILFTLYDFPAEHWVHIRSTNVIESMFATVRLRTEKTKDCGTSEILSIVGDGLFSRRILLFIF